VFNQVISQYASLDQKPRVIYLSAEANPGGDGWDFEISVAADGNAYVHLCPSERIKLRDVKVPAGVAVEVLPAASVPLDPEQRAKLEADQKPIEAFVVRCKTTADLARTIRPGVMAPRLIATAADGSPVAPDPDAPLPRAMANMHVLVVFWSLHDREDPGLIGPLTELYREFRKGRFQIASVCIDDDFPAWITSLDNPRRINDRVWWQLTQAASGGNCAETFAVSRTPAAFLIQPDGRFVATDIPAAKLRKVVANALDWDAP
jgi:hypothetical protein